MKPVLVDTSAWFALVDVKDRNHEAAKKFMASAPSDRIRLLTTNLVIGETFTLLRARHGYLPASQFLKAMENAGNVTRVFVSEQLEQKAAKLLERYSDVALSYIDATSFAVMRDLGLRECFGFDRHFLAGGFVLVPAGAYLKLNP